MKKQKPADAGGAPAAEPQPVPNRNQPPAGPPDWARLTAMTDAELIELARGTVKRATAIEKAEAAFSASLHVDAKVCAALKRLYARRIAEHAIPGDTKFADFYEANAGGAAPGRVLALANVWNSLVEITPQRLTEEKFDRMPVDALERAGAIIAAARKAEPEKWADNPHVRQTVEILNTPPPDGCSKALKAVREEQGTTAKAAKPKPVEAVVEEARSTGAALPGEFGPATITYVVRQATLRRMLPRLVADLGAEIASLKGTPEELLAVVDALNVVASMAGHNKDIMAAVRGRTTPAPAKPAPKAAEGALATA